MVTVRLIGKTGREMYCGLDDKVLESTAVVRQAPGRSTRVFLACISRDQHSCFREATVTWCGHALPDQDGPGASGEAA